MTRFVAIDIETSGLSVHEGHEIIRFCAVEICGQGILGSWFQTLIRPKRHLIPTAAKLTGLSNRQLADAPSFREVAPLVIHFVQDATLVSTHVSFERPFLNRAFQSVGLPPLAPSRFFDVRSQMPQGLRSRCVSEIYDLLGINLVETDRPSEGVARLYFSILQAKA